MKDDKKFAQQLNVSSSKDLASGAEEIHASETSGKVVAIDAEEIIAIMQSDEMANTGLKNGAEHCDFSFIYVLLLRAETES